MKTDDKILIKGKFFQYTEINGAEMAQVIIGNEPAFVDPKLIIPVKEFATNAKEAIDLIDQLKRKNTGFLFNE